MRLFKDTRGKSWFDIIEDLPGQIDVTISYPGTIRGFHLHKEKVEYLYAIEGEFKVVLTDPNEVVYLSQGEKIRIEPGRWHGYQVLDEKGIMMEYATHKHNVENPDDFRKPWDEFDHWEKEKK